MGRTLYLECYSGISGDMTVAALLDLGADQEVLRKALKSLPVSGFHTEIKTVLKSGLQVCDFEVHLDEDNHDHDMNYLYGHGKKEEHNHGGCENHHAHHAYGEPGEHHQHSHRGIHEIREILNAADLTDRARNTALRIFKILAEAEAEAHGVPVEEVHFHEVGAIDSIVDITAAAVCLDNLDITRVIVPGLYDGTGFIRCQHGQIPVPVPAVVNIVRRHGLKLRITDIRGELVTPTGAAIVAAIRTDDQLPDGFLPQKIGMGAGKRTYDCPGILRAMLAEEKVSETEDLIYKLETDIDDCSGEILGFLMQQLYDAGAREAHYSPVFMKKNRPAYELTVICKKEDVAKLENLIFYHTTTIGIRKTPMSRSVLKRKIESIDTEIGKATVKICTLPDGEIRCYPEYESAAVLSKEHQISLSEAYEKIKYAWAVSQKD